MERVGRESSRGKREGVFGFQFSVFSRNGKLKTENRKRFPNPELYCAAI
jgi:hypothetical protein